MTRSIISEEVGGSLGAEDAARGEAVRNESESKTDAGRWRLVERLLDRREAHLDEREARVREREAVVAVGIKEAELGARAAATAILEEARVSASATIRTALDEAGKIVQRAAEEAGQLGQKASVDASAIRQAAQDHLAAGIALADAARLPAPPAPTGGQMLAKLGEVFVSRGMGVFEKLMLANPEAGARLAGGIADAFGNKEAAAEAGESQGAAPPKPPSFTDVARAAEAVGEEALTAFLKARGVADFADLSLADGVALVEYAVAHTAKAGHAAT